MRRLSGTSPVPPEGLKPSKMKSPRNSAKKLPKKTPSAASPGGGKDVVAPVKKGGTGRKRSKASARNRSAAPDLAAKQPEDQVVPTLPESGPELEAALPVTVDMETCKAVLGGNFDRDWFRRTCGEDGVTKDLLFEAFGEALGMDMPKDETCCVGYNAGQILECFANGQTRQFGVVSVISPMGSHRVHALQGLGVDDLTKFDAVVDGQATEQGNAEPSEPLLNMQLEELNIVTTCLSPQIRPMGKRRAASMLVARDPTQQPQQQPGSVHPRLVEIRRSCWKGSIPSGPHWYGVPDTETIAEFDAANIPTLDLEVERKEACANLSTSQADVVRQACDALQSFFHTGVSEETNLRIEANGSPVIALDLDVHSAGAKIIFEPHYRGLPEVKPTHAVWDMACGAWEPPAFAFDGVALTIPASSRKVWAAVNQVLQRSMLRAARCHVGFAYTRGQRILVETRCAPQRQAKMPAGVVASNLAPRQDLKSPVALLDPAPDSAVFSAVFGVHGLEGPWACGTVAGLDRDGRYEVRLDNPELGHDSDGESPGKLMIDLNSRNHRPAESIQYVSGTRLFVLLSGRGWTAVRVARVEDGNRHRLQVDDGTQRTEFLSYDLNAANHFPRFSETEDFGESLDFHLQELLALAHVRHSFTWTMVNIRDCAVQVELRPRGQEQGIVISMEHLAKVMLCPLPGREQGDVSPTVLILEGLPGTGKSWAALRLIIAAADAEAVKVPAQPEHAENQPRDQVRYAPLLISAVDWARHCCRGTGPATGNSPTDLQGHASGVLGGTSRPETSSATSTAGSSTPGTSARPDAMVVYLHSVFASSPRRLAFLLQAYQSRQLIVAIDGIDDVPAATPSLLQWLLEDCVAMGTRVLVTCNSKWWESAGGVRASKIDRKSVV